jgi:hypothetical protein
MKLILSLNPFNFQHYNVKRIAFIVNGKEVDKALELDNKKDKFIRAYQSLFTVISGDVGDRGLDITKK